MADSPISHYVINAVNLNSTGVMNMVVTANTTTNATFFNVTGLLPGTTYEMDVVATSQGGDIVAKSLASDTVVDSTDVTGQLVNITNHMRVVAIILLSLRVQFLRLRCAILQCLPVVTSQLPGPTSTPEGYLSLTSSSPIHMRMIQLLAVQITFLSLASIQHLLLLWSCRKALDTLSMSLLKIVMEPRVHCVKQYSIYLVILILIQRMMLYFCIPTTGTSITTQCSYDCMGYSYGYPGPQAF